ncbi:hypothetical protein [Reichenbachiella sp.]|uniref:hypothetical protein n=1 Tax=Reichenbachiella sp. TaxID=2184521 RepID=UPI003B5BD4E2
MRQIFLFIAVLTSNLLVAQKSPNFLQEGLDFCNTNLSDEQTTQLRKELTNLEDYFLTHGLLNDKSGTSYRDVYKQITQENDLIFEIDTTFELLDNLDFQVYTSCFYKVLTPEQLNQLTPRHLEATQRISSSYDGNITPSLVAQRILDNLTADDFDLEYFRISSLLTFYRISSPTPSLNLGLPDFGRLDNPNIQTIHVILNANNQILIEDKTLTIESAKKAIYDYLSAEPEARGIELTASRGASYEAYINVTNMFNSVYSKLTSELGEIPKNIIFNEPK